MLVTEARCPTCGPRKYRTVDNTGERQEFPFVVDIFPGPLNWFCSCGQQVMITTEPVAAEPSADFRLLYMAEVHGGGERT